jgi:hypothetical protein
MLYYTVLNPTILLNYSPRAALPLFQAQDFPANFSSAILSLLPTISAGSGFRDFGSSMLSAIASAAAFLSLSASSILISFPPTRSFDSFSSSLSPRLNGSLSVSPIGLGSTVDNGCHLLCFPDGAAFSFAGVTLGELP